LTDEQNTRLDIAGLDNDGLDNDAILRSTVFRFAVILPKMSKTWLYLNENTLVSGGNLSPESHRSFVAGLHWRFLPPDRPAPCCLNLMPWLHVK